MIEVVTRSSLLPAWVEPIDAYERLRESEPVLLDGMGAHPEARFAYLALHPRLRATVHGDHMRIQHEDGTEEARSGPGLELVQALVDAWRTNDAEPGFTGGFVGTFSYEAAWLVEPTLPAAKAADGPGVPDVDLSLYRDALVFDRVAGTVTAYASDLPGENGAARRLETTCGILTRTETEPKHPQVEGPASPDERTWTTSLDRATFMRHVDRLKRRIGAGDLFQANLATRFTTPRMGADPAALYRALQAHNPSPFMALFERPDHAIVSGSPEQLFAVESGVIRSRPIAGTRPRGTEASADQALEDELFFDPKERAEHTMLVDLVRNDIARVSTPGSVHVPELMSVERYRRVMHLVSRIEGDLRDDATFTDCIRALFPGGTITGAPKHRACLRIHEEEPVPRGPYTGSAGYLSWDHRSSHWNIMIRTLVLDDASISVHAGSGIVIDSDAEREWHEAGHKARALVEAVTAPAPAPTPTPAPAGTATGAGAGAGAGADPAGTVDRVGEVTTRGAWAPSGAKEQVQGVRLLLVDNYDSFVGNLADMAAALGADVRVIRNDIDWRSEFDEFDPTHILLGPGPGTPGEAGHCADILDASGDLPVMGVCLGHQVMAAQTGGLVAVHHEVVHGRPSPIHVHGGRLLAGLGEGWVGGRYHSLVVDRAGADWDITATLDDGTIMAMEHKTRPWFGLQFHPESICTEHGWTLMARFLGGP